ncbi:MAG: DAK2 domain-containing protein [Clostridiales bacterium]|jgi:DAK2 domain fusion protein YloV|nr:DAK2 domain-containing protein [Clostridiales bacterium]
MGTISVDGNLLKKMMIAGSNALNKRRNEIDAMNVFPVPDGDTGINMSMTVLAAASEAAKMQTPNIYDVAKAAASGSLRGARGNSGVILSQLFRGFARGLEEIEIAGMRDFATAAQKSVETAYKAVMRPKEGTILTIAKALAEQAANSCDISNDIEIFLRRCVNHANSVLDRTPQMLPELKAAGVVDAGGKGLLVFLEGALHGLNKPQEALLGIGEAKPDELPKPLSAAAASTADIRFSYCTEFFINANEINESAEDEFKMYLETIGDSIVAVADDNIMKIHVHTNHPGRVLERAITIGSLSNLKIENMRLQHTTLINFSTRSGQANHIQTPSDDENTKQSQNPKDVGFVAVAAGDGLIKLFKSLGCDVVIEGGQTMNPSTEDILRGIERVNARTVYALPNNKNIILAAEQAAQLVRDKNAVVLKTKSMPQGLSALIGYVPTFSPEDNEALMNEAMENTHVGQITYAVRDTAVNGFDIKKGDFLCVLDGEIAASRKNLTDAARALIDQITTDGADVISIYYGADTNEAQANELKAYVRDVMPNCETEVLYGGQPVYYFIISAE